MKQIFITIIFLFTVAPIVSSQTIDQSHTGTNGEYTCLNTTQILGQSFTAEISGALTQISIDFALSCPGASSYPVTIEIMPESIDASPLASESIVISLPYNRNMLEVNFSNPANVTAGNLYVIKITPNNVACMYDPFMDPVEACGKWYVSGSDGYTSGTAYIINNGQINQDGNNDRYFTTTVTEASPDIILNGTVSAQNNQIKNVNNPTNAQDVATKSYVDNNVNSFSGSYNDLTDTPTMYTQTQVDALISNLQSQIDGLTTPQGTAAINHNNKTYTGVSCEGFWLGFKFTVSDTQTITALGAWDEGHNVVVNDEFSSCPDASNFSVPIAIYKNDVLVLEKVINASNGVVIGNSRYIRIDDFVLIPGNEYFIIGNYEGSSKFGYFDSNLASSDYDSRITPLTVTSSSLFSRNTNGDGTFPSNLTTLSDNQWSDHYFHANFLLKN